jgi:hypothetical protein
VKTKDVKIKTQASKSKLKVNKKQNKKVVSLSNKKKKGIPKTTSVINTKLAKPSNESSRSVKAVTGRKVIKKGNK